MTKCFVGGTVVMHVDGIEECAAGVEVVLTRDGIEVGRATTDSFGEFKIDRLEPGGAGYRLQATSPAGRFVAEFELGDDSLYLGLLTLTRA